MGVYLFRRVHDWARSEVREEADEFFFFFLLVDRMIELGLLSASAR